MWGIGLIRSWERGEETQTSGEVLFQVTLFCYEITTKQEECDWPRKASSCVSVLLNNAGRGLPGLDNNGGRRSLSGTEKSSLPFRWLRRSGFSQSESK